MMHKASRETPVYFFFGGGSRFRTSRVGAFSLFSGNSLSALYLQGIEGFPIFILAYGGVLPCTRSMMEFARGMNRLRVIKWLVMNCEPAREPTVRSTVFPAAKTDEISSLDALDARALHRKYPALL